MKSQNNIKEIVFYVGIEKKINKNTLAQMKIENY